MKYFIFLLFPICAYPQKELPRLENDTLFTSCGYKIYAGQMLHLSNGSDGEGHFRFFKMYGGSSKHFLAQSTILVKKLEGFRVSGLGNGYIKIFGSIIYKDNSKESIEVAINFDKAIEGYLGQFPELIVPNEYKTPKKENIADQLQKLKELLDSKAITEEEYNAAKKKILNL